MGPGKVGRLAGLSSEAESTTQEFEAFFRPLVTIEDWFEPDDRELARRYQRLKKTMETHLSDIAVYKFGRIQKEVFIVGLTEDGGIGGLRTKGVER